LTEVAALVGPKNVIYHQMGSFFAAQSDQLGYASTDELPGKPSLLQPGDGGELHVSLRYDPEGLKTFLSPKFRNIQEVLPIEAPWQYPAFEWIARFCSLSYSLLMICFMSQSTRLSSIC
jgi:hypothetical protein